MKLSSLYRHNNRSNNRENYRSLLGTRTMVTVSRICWQATLDGAGLREGFAPMYAGAPNSSRQRVHSVGSEKHGCFAVTTPRLNGPQEREMLLADTTKTTKTIRTRMWTELTAIRLQHSTEHSASEARGGGRCG